MCGRLHISDGLELAAKQTDSAIPGEVRCVADT
jgi:hypothetical protein